MLKRLRTIGFLSILMVLCFSTSVLAADYKFSSLTGSGQIEIYEGYAWKFNFALTNLRTDAEGLGVANLNFTLRIPGYNLQNQQGDYDGYDNVYAIFNINDRNATVYSSVLSGVPVDKTSTTEIFGLTTATLKVYGDGDIIYRKTGMPTAFRLFDGKADPDEFFIQIGEGSDTMLYTEQYGLPTNTIITNYTLIGRNQNQQ